MRVSELDVRRRVTSIAMRYQVSIMIQRAYGGLKVYELIDTLEGTARGDLSPRLSPKGVDKWLDAFEAGLILAAKVNKEKPQ